MHYGLFRADYVTGRLKELIIIRGQNHYPHDIEATALNAHEALRPAGAAAFSLDTEEGEGLGLLLEIERGYFDVDLALVENAVRDAVSRQHQLQVAKMVFVRPGGVPKTSSGKIQRLLARQKLQSGDLPLIGSPAAEAIV